MIDVDSTPIRISVEYPERLSRLHLLLKSFFGWLYVMIPHGVALLLYALVAMVASFIAFVAILFTGRYPRGLFDLVVGYHRWAARVEAYMWHLMTDRYPPFSPGAGSNPVNLEVDYPERLSRGMALLKFFFAWLYVGIPHGIALLIYGILVFFVLFVSWWAILILGRFPRGLFDFVLGYVGWSTRVSLYFSLLRDEYPPFSGRP